MTRSVRGIAALLVASLLTACESVPRVTGEVGADGMVRLENTGFHEAWMRPDLDLAGYTKVMVEPVSCQQRPVEPGSGTLDAEQREEQRARLSAILSRALDAALSESERFTLVREPGPDVLVLRPALTDVVSYSCVGLTQSMSYYENRQGRGTLELELRDASTGELLARCSDRQAAQRTDPALKSDGAMRDMPEVEAVARMWARRAQRHLDQLAALVADRTSPGSGS